MQLFELQVHWLVGWEIKVTFHHKNGLYRGQGGDLVSPGYGWQATQ